MIYEEKGFEHGVLRRFGFFLEYSLKEVSREEEAIKLIL